MPRKYTRKHPTERFWSKVDTSAGPNGCWLWQGALLPKGYGQFTIGHQRGYAHRFSYELAHGPVPPDMFVCHTCDNPRCVNPAHLFSGTTLDNVRDKVAKGRQPRGDSHYSRTRPELVRRGDGHPWRQRPELIPRGERSSQAKLTEQQVRDIRARHADGGTNQSALAREYGVAVNTIGRIVRRLLWRHLA